MQSSSFSKYSFDISPRRLKRSATRRQILDYANPFVIFTTGPTGSGKSGLVRKTLQLLYMSNKVPTYESFILDDLIENNDEYKQMIKTIIDKYECKKSTDPGSSCDIQNPNPDMIKDMNVAYWKIRGDKGYCGNPNESCDGLFNIQWRQAVIEGKNMVIETTGKVIPWWFIKDFHTLSGGRQYNIIFTYALASFDTLIERNINRAVQKFKEFIDDDRKAAPRLPDISKPAFKPATDTILKTLIALRNKCLRITKPGDIICGNDEQSPPQPTNLINSKGNYVLLIFDNEKRQSKLIYDSRNNDDRLMDNFEFISLLSRFRLNAENSHHGGGSGSGSGSGGRSLKKCRQRRCYQTYRRSRRNS